MKIIISNPAKTVSEYQLNPLKISITLPISSPAILLTTPANKAKTKNGAACMTKSTIFKNTSLIPSTNVKTGCDFSLGMNSKHIPKNKAKKIICNINPLLESDAKKISGTISTKPPYIKTLNKYNQITLKQAFIFHCGLTANTSQKTKQKR